MIAIRDEVSICGPIGPFTFLCAALQKANLFINMLIEVALFPCFFSQACTVSWVASLCLAFLLCEKPNFSLYLYILVLTGTSSIFH
jgi:hypothetical protein